MSPALGRIMMQSDLASSCAGRCMAKKNREYMAGRDDAVLADPMLILRPRPRRRNVAREIASHHHVVIIEARCAEDPR